MENGQNSPGWIDTRLDAYDPPCPEERFTSANAFAALVHAWDLLRLVLVRFWTPQQLANLPHIRQARRLEFLDWLQPLELMLRRMLFIEAAALASTLPEPAPRRPVQRKPTTSSRTTRPFDPDCPEAWRVSFNTMPLARAGGLRRACNVERRSEKPRESQRTVDARPLAFRLEALIRIAADPLVWVKRLAVRMRRQGAPSPRHLAKPHRCRVAALPADPRPARHRNRPPAAGAA